MLRTAMGSAFLYTVNSTRNKLGLPEVIEEEIIKHTEIVAIEAKEKIERSFRDIKAIIGRHSPYSLPNEQEVKESISERFDKLEKLIVRQPFILKHAKSALNRVNKNIPPSSTKQQQFKDAAIWEATLDLGKRYDVYLVSNDSDFYENKDRQALNKILQKEADKAQIIVKIFSDLESCLKELQKNRPTINTKDISIDIFKSILDKVTKSVVKHNLRVTTLDAHDLRAFITEDHDVLAIEYTITLDAINTDTNELNEDSSNSVHIKGSCRYNTKIKHIEHNQLNLIEANWVDLSGENQATRHIFAYGEERESTLQYTSKLIIDES